MWDWIAKTILGSDLVGKKVKTAAGAVVAWAIGMKIIDAGSGDESTQILFTIFMGLIELALIAAHAWTDRAHLRAGAAKEMGILNKEQIAKAAAEIARDLVKKGEVQ